MLLCWCRLKKNKNLSYIYYNVSIIEKDKYNLFKYESSKSK